MWMAIVNAIILVSLLCCPLKNIVAMKFGNSTHVDENRESHHLRVPALLPAQNAKKILIRHET